MKIRKKDVRLSDSYYSKSEIKELYSRGLINIRDYSEIKIIHSKGGNAYLNGVLIDYYYLDHTYSFGNTFFYAKKNNSIVVCNVYCRTDGIIDSKCLRIYGLNILDRHNKLKCIL